LKEGSSPLTVQPRSLELTVGQAGQLDRHENQDDKHRLITKDGGTETRTLGNIRVVACSRIGR